MNKKLRLKEMSRKQLRKLAKGLAKELKDTSELANQRGEQWNEATRQIEIIKDREVRWKAQFDAEVHYKTQALRLVNELEDELNRYKMQKDRDDKTIETLREACDFLGGSSEDVLKWKAAYEYLSRYPGTFKYDGNEWVITGLEGAIDLGVKISEATYIGQMPDNLQMGVDGQLRVVGHQPFDEPTNGVVCDVCKGGGYEQFPGEPCRECNGERVIKPADVDAAVEWAKRNGHHQPEGNPEPDKMETVKVKSADEISAENREKHTEMVCKDIQEDKSRLLVPDPMFDEKGKHHQSMD